MITEQKIAIAKQRGIRNVRALATACEGTDVPFAVGCALVEKESFGGRNVWGRADASLLAGYLGPVNVHTFRLFYWLVTQRGMPPTGVGPCQITYAGTLRNGTRDGGYFRIMLERGLRPWVPVDNMTFGLGLLRANFDRHGSWTEAGAHYNGGTNPDASAIAYGLDLVEKAAAWRALFRRARG